MLKGQQVTELKMYSEGKILGGQQNSKREMDTLRTLVRCSGLHESATSLKRKAKALART